MYSIRIIILSFLEFLLLFSVLFVGDFSINEIKVAPFIVFFAFFYYVLNYSRQNKSILESLFLSITFFLIVALSSLVNMSSGIYQFWYLIPFISIFFIKDALDIDFKAISWIILLLTLFFVFLQFVWLLEGGTRGRAIFGPNILYRIFLFFVLISYFQYRGMISFFIIITCILGIFLTGSRGGLVCGAMVLLALILTSPGLKVDRNFIYLAFLSPIVIYIFLPQFEIADFVFNRIFMLSEGTYGNRLDFLRSATIFFNVSFLELIFGVGVYPNRFFSFYPHNLIVEMFVSHGIVVSFLFISVSIYISLYTFLNRNRISKQQRFLFLIFVLFFSSSQVSGSFYDNWVCIPLAFCLLGTYLKKYQRTIK